MRRLKEIVSAPAFKLLGYRPQKVSADAWNREYRDGQWKYVETIGAIAGLVSILGYCQFLAPDSILDVGCGAGVLAAKLKVLPFKSYLGIDFSPEAIAQAQNQRDARTAFAVADATDFHTDRTFDVIIFNQCLYYLPDPVGTLSHYARFLSPAGRFIVSHAESARTRTVWPLIERDTIVEDWMRYEQADGRGTTKVLRPRATV